MKCCKKFVAVAVLVALGIVTISALKHGWGRVVKDHVSSAFKSHVPPEVQLERVKGLIKDLDSEIAKGWTPIATRMEDIKDLKKDVELKTSKLETVKAEMCGQGVEGLAVIRQIGDQRIDAGMIKRLEVDIEQVVTPDLQMRQDMPAGLAGSPGEYYAPACHFLPPSVVDGMVETYRDPAALMPATGNSGSGRRPRQ